MLAFPHGIVGVGAARKPVSTPDDFDQWCARVALGAMATLFAATKAQARVFQQQTGLFVDVVYPAQAPSGLAYSAREMFFMQVAMDGREVHLYSARNPGKYPALHVVSSKDQMRPSLSSSHVDSNDPRRFARQRLVSTLLCRVYPTRDGGFELYESTQDDKRAAVDDIVHRIFEELVDKVHSSRRER
jgi:hypothetical protein